MSVVEKALLGKRILITRPKEQIQGFAMRLQKLGAEPVIFPSIQLMPPKSWENIDHAISQIKRFDWIVFTSVNGVRFFMRRLRTLGYDSKRLSSLKIAAIGPVTADSLVQQGLVVDFVPSRYLAEAIAEGMGDVHDQHVLLPRADIARKDLTRSLQARGAHVEDVAIYRTKRAAFDPARIKKLFQDGIDIATFTSASTVRSFARALGEERHLLTGVTIACIGPITARAAEDVGLPVQIVAQEHTVGGLISAIVEEVNQ